MDLSLRDPAGKGATAAALAYATAGYLAGLGLLVTVSPLWMAGGALWLAHALVIGAYLLHDALHLAVFRHPEANRLLALPLSWMTGACYWRFDDLQHKHLRHHADRADVLAFDHRTALGARPRLRRLVEALEWAYIPAVDLVVRAHALGRPFIDPDFQPGRGRVAGCLASRTGLLGLLAWASPLGALGYLAALLGMMTVLRFMDTFQHTYPVVVTPGGRGLSRGERPPKTSETPNTYSNLLSLRWPVLDLLTLNFAYHNAHHMKPLVGWHRLPSLHEELFGDDQRQVLPARGLLARYHRGRVARVMGENDPDGLLGAVGVSFLTPT